MTDQDSPSRTAADDVERRDRSLARAGVVHDVNQMLAVITGRAGLLLKGTEDAELARHLRAILLASGDAASILRRLDVDGGPAAVGPDATALRDVGEQARLLVWPPDEGAFAWENRVGAGLRTTVPAQVLREVLCNLFLNALEVMPGGGRIVLSAAAGSADRVALRVADSGPGLPPGDVEQFFVRGVSGSGQEGRGIGLAGCRQLLAGVGGTLAAETGATEGAVFVLDLPVSEGPGQVRTQSVDTVPAVSVLVVDDETVVREMLHDVLSEWGCTVQTCRDGQAALAEYVPGSAAVAFIDLNLPGLGGLELATRLRVGDPCLSIVMVTGWQQETDLARADPAVVDQKAHKPLELERIRDILVEGHQLNQVRCASASHE